MAQRDQHAAPVFGLTRLPPGIRLASDLQLTPVPKGRAKAQLGRIDITRQPRPAELQPAAVRGEDGKTEEVSVDGKFGPLVHKVGGNSDHIRMGVPQHGFQRKWWYEATTTEQEVLLIQAAKTNRLRSALVPPERGQFSFIQKSVSERLTGGAAEAVPDVDESAAGLPGQATETRQAEIFVPGQRGVSSQSEADQRSDGRPFDIVIYGATGYTGCLIAQHLDALLSEAGAQQHRWALAGRDLKRLLAMAAKCKAPSLHLVLLGDMAANSSVVIAAAGPYGLCGEPVVEACVHSGTHYVDVTGEIPFVADMVRSYHELARSKGVMVVHCAGQIATLDDINCYLLVKRLGKLTWFREYWNSLDAVTGGTFNTSIASVHQMENPEVLRLLADPFSLGGRRAASTGSGVQHDDPVDAEQDETVFPGTWLQPTYNSRPGSRIVRRSCALFEEVSSDDVSYGAQLSVAIREPASSQRAAQKCVEESRLPSSPEAAALATTVLQGMQDRGEVPPPGQGPPAKLRARHWSDIYAVAQSESGTVAHVHYTGPQSYEVTAISSVAAALTIIEEKAVISPAERGGVLTPAFAFHGSTFVQRIQARPFAGGLGQKMRFDLVPGKPAGTVLKEGLNRRMREFAELNQELAAGALTRWEPPALGTS